MIWARPLIWARPCEHEERQVREFLLNETCCSETARSLSVKLGLSRERCRRALDQMVNEGVVRRRDFTDMEPIYYRYPVR